MAEGKEKKRNKRTGKGKKPATKVVSSKIASVESVQAHIENKDILTGRIILVSREKSTGEQFVVVKVSGWQYKILDKDIDNELNIHSLANFLNRTVQFVVTEIVSPGHAKASRAMAQKMTMKKTLEKIEKGDKVKAQVVNILPHGAYVDVDGVTGLLKNIDWASDTTAIGDIMHVGEYLYVKLKKRSSNGTIIFEAVKKYTSPDALTIDGILEDSIVSGVVRAVQPFGVFVQVVVGYDALCSNRGMQELEEDDKVSVRITMVDKESKKIRGEILSRIQN